MSGKKVSFFCGKIVVSGKNREKESQNKLIVFQSRQIRRIWRENEWFYSVVDICEALTDSPTPRQYWGKVKQREFVKLELSPIWVQLKLPAKDGKIYKTDCVAVPGLCCMQHKPDTTMRPSGQQLHR